jgi:hypothetical protein
MAEAGCSYRVDDLDLILAIPFEHSELNFEVEEASARTSSENKCL